MIVHYSPLLKSSPPPIPNYTNKTIPNHISSLYLQLSITAILIHNATLLSCHFRKIATVSHFRLVLMESSLNPLRARIKYLGLGFLWVASIKIIQSKYLFAFWSLKMNSIIHMYIEDVNQNFLILVWKRNELWKISSTGCPTKNYTLFWGL